MRPDLLDLPVYQRALQHHRAPAHQDVAGPLSGDLTEDDAVVQWEGEEPESQAGLEVSLGDFDGDGVQDLASFVGQVHRVGLLTPRSAIRYLRSASATPTITAMMRAARATQIAI